jgi:hypothetical protein
VAENDQHYESHAKTISEQNAERKNIDSQETATSELIHRLI